MMRGFARECTLFFHVNVIFAGGCSQANYALLECQWKEEDKVKESSYCFNANGTACKGYEPSAQ